MCGEYFRLCKLLMLDADPVDRGLRTSKWSDVSVTM